MRVVRKICHIALIGLTFSPSHAQSQSARSQPNDDGLSHTHIFGGNINIQGMHQQFSLANSKGPLPIGVTASVQKWLTGPPLANLYTQMAQGYIPVTDKLKVVFSEIFQKQGNIELANIVAGVSYQAGSHLSINATSGLGTNAQNTYRYSFYFSPQYTLPYTQNNKKIFSAEAGLTYQNFELGEFTQITPKLNWHVSDSLPLVSIGYSFGNFKNTSNQKTNGYYQPKTLNGAMLTGVVKPSEFSFLALTWYPANRNNIAGFDVIQDTVGATLHYNWSSQLRFSVFSQFQVTRGSGNDVALGVSASFNF